MCLAQGHNVVTQGRLESAAPPSRVKHSTTEPLCSLLRFCNILELSHCCVALPGGAMGLSAVCDCGIS